VVVDHVDRNVSGVDGRDERVAPWPGGTGHHEVEPAVGGGRRGLGREPVRHQQTGPAPLVLEDAVVDLVLLRRRDAVDVVVRRHDRPRVGVGDGDLERQQVHLSQGALVDDAVHRVPLGLGLVGHQMLQAGADTARLQSLDVGRREQAGQQRVLRVRLEEPAAQGRAVQVDGGTEDDVDVLPLCLLGQQLADGVRRADVPGRGEQRRVGQQAGLPPATELQAPDAGRSVGEGHRPQADRLLAVEREEAGSGQQPDLRLEVELAEQAVEVHQDSAVWTW
jgi:hypothetical protein